LALTQAGFSREAAYAAVQRNAMAVWDEGGSFRARLAADPEVAASVDPATLDGLFDPAYHTARVDEIFERVFGSG
jgi:adenylosuccinate lyase